MFDYGLLSRYTSPHRSFAIHQLIRSPISIRQVLVVHRLFSPSDLPGRSNPSALFDDFNMLCFSFNRRSSLKFIALFILVPIAVVTSAPATGGPSGSNELKSVIVSFPTELQNAYPLALLKDDRTTLEALVKHAIAVDVKHLMPLPNGRKDLSGEDVDLQGSMTLFRDPATKKYVVPYEVSSISSVGETRVFKDMVLEMWFVANSGNPKVQLKRRIGGKMKRKDVSKPEIAVKSYFVAANFDTGPVEGAERLGLRGVYEGLLYYSECLSSAVVTELGKAIDVVEEDVAAIGYPRVWATSERYIVPYKVEYFAQQEHSYDGGRLEVLKPKKGETEKGKAALEVYRMEGKNVAKVITNSKSRTATILIQIAELGVEAEDSPTDPNRFSKLMKFITRKDDWETGPNVWEFLADYRARGDESHVDELEELVHSQSGVPFLPSTP
ncbi:hypothetical protein EV360DRAFT_88524 [Lentinula raphanica]|nr:hypothetical protein EV360DRAFT_88524 [Lentinula raphanica]